MASETPMPLLAIATPATRPHAAMPIAIGIASAAPSRNMGRREVATASARSDATQDLRDTLPSVEAGLSRETRAARFQRRDAAAGLRALRRCAAVRGTILRPPPCAWRTPW